MLVKKLKNFSEFVDEIIFSRINKVEGVGGVEAAFSEKLGEREK